MRAEFSAKSEDWFAAKQQGERREYQQLDHTRGRPASARERVQDARQTLIGAKETGDEQEPS
jgi:hypothetical protein